jgi:tetratricopeptide (TPR) repeat protein
LFDLEREALIASGIQAEENIRDYHSKFDFFFQKYRPSAQVDAPPLEWARTVFDSLWKGRPNRYINHRPFRLNQVIDAQLGRPNQPVGNCLGLTLLYNCLLRRIGICAQALYLEEAFQAGPHVLTFLRIDDVETDVENVLADGFDYKGYKENPHRVEWGDKELVGDIYQSVGTETFQREEFREALRNYDLALKFNPGYEKARLNRAILLDRMGINR